MNFATLAARQQEFMTQVLKDDLALPPGWTERHAAGIAIYRNAYRARLVEALRDTYERTARWVGEEAFRQAVAHHVITHPPSSWTLDAAGDGFPGSLRELFANDPEVPELAWLEWALHRSFVATDATALDAIGFSAIGATFEEEDWATMRLGFLPGTYLREMNHDTGKLWRALGEEHAETPDYSSSEPQYCIVWREGLKPVFIQVDVHEGQALDRLLGGASYGETCEALIEQLGEQEAASEAGAMLGRWLKHGMIAGVTK